MDVKKFKTLVKKEEGLGDNEYVRGRISGIIIALCYDENKHPYRWSHADEKGRVITIRCTDEQYDKFKEIVDECYPNLCQFNY